MSLICLLLVLLQTFYLGIQMFELTFLLIFQTISIMSKVLHMSFEKTILTYFAQAELLKNQSRMHWVEAFELSAHVLRINVEYSKATDWVINNNSLFLKVIVRQINYNYILLHYLFTLLCCYLFSPIWQQFIPFREKNPLLLIGKRLWRISKSGFH